MGSPLFPALGIGFLLGTLNHFYLQSKGHHSTGQWFLQIIVFFALAFSVLKFLL